MSKIQQMSDLALMALFIAMTESLGFDHEGPQKLFEEIQRRGLDRPLDQEIQ